MIEYIGRSGGPEAMNCPLLICDACRKQVVDHGNILWGSTVGVEPRRGTPLYVSHKGECDLIAQAALEALYPGDEWVWLSEEASRFLGHLNHNFTHKMTEGTQLTYHPHVIAHPDPHLT